MGKLFILYSHHGFFYQHIHNRRILSEKSLENSIDKNWVDIFPSTLTLQEVEIICSVPQFSIFPYGYEDDVIGAESIAWNASHELPQEAMLSMHPKFALQWYFSIIKEDYNLLKNKFPNATFEFSGGKFLQSISIGKGKECHIHLEENTCEFLMLSHKKLVLYNFLEASEEIDFLYFIMFSLKKVHFEISRTRFSIYGNTKLNITFIEELKRFGAKVSIKPEHANGRHFLFN